MDFYGIDPGKEGAIVQLNEDMHVVSKFVYPLLPDKTIDIKEFSNYIKKLKNKNVIVYLEDVHSVYGASSKANFTFGFNVAIPEVLLYAYSIPFIKVQPKKWQSIAWQGIPKIQKKGKKSKDTKKMSAMACKRIFPNVNLTKNSRCTVAHEGIVDALLIAYYGLRSYKL